MDSEVVNIQKLPGSAHFSFFRFLYSKTEVPIAGPDVKGSRSASGIKIPKINLYDLVDLLSGRVEFEKIYYLAHEIYPEGIIYAELLLVLAPTCKKTPAEIEAAVEIASLNRHQLNFQLFTSKEFAHLVKEGNIYYIAASNKDKLIYHNPRYPLPLINIEQYITSRIKANKDFNKGLKHIKELQDLAEDAYIVNIDAVPALLNHIAKLCLHMLIKTLTGRNMHAHLIEELLTISKRLNLDIPTFLDKRLYNPILELLELGSKPAAFHCETEIEKRGVLILMETIGSLIVYTEDTYQKWLTAFDKVILDYQPKG